MTTDTSSMRNGNNSKIHNKSSKYSTNALFLTCLTDNNPANFYSWQLFSLTNVADDVSLMKSDLRPQTALILLALIFGVAGIFLAFVYSSFPEIEETESQHVKFPKVILIILTETWGH